MHVMGPYRVGHGMSVTRWRAWLGGRSVAIQGCVCLPPPPAPQWQVLGCRHCCLLSWSRFVLHQCNAGRKQGVGWGEARCWRSVVSNQPQLFTFAFAAGAAGAVRRRCCCVFVCGEYLIVAVVVAVLPLARPSTRSGCPFTRCGGTPTCSHWLAHFHDSHVSLPTTRTCPYPRPARVPTHDPHVYLPTTRICR
jgi:hypothetical protein